MTTKFNKLISGAYCSITRLLRHLGMLKWVIVLLLTLSVTVESRAQCPPPSADYTVSGPSATDYGLTSGDTLYLAPGAEYTGELALNGGVLINCATLPQNFPMFLGTSSGTAGSIIQNYGTLHMGNSAKLLNGSQCYNYGELTSGASFAISSSADLYNYGIVTSGGVLSTSTGATIENYASIVTTGSTINNGGSEMTNHPGATWEVVDDLTIGGTFNNYGSITVNDQFKITSGDTFNNHGGCVHAGRMAVQGGTLHGISCGTITIDGFSYVSSSTGIISGDIAIVDLSLTTPGTIVDSNSATIEPSVTDEDCGCPGMVVPEDCSNGVDDDLDGFTDCDDPDCGVAVPQGLTGDMAFDVYSQIDFNAYGGGLSQAKLGGAVAIVVDPTTSKVFVSDYINNRVLRYASTQSLLDGDPAEGVLGQSDFTSSTTGSAQNQFYFPQALAIDGSGCLFVADQYNHRILRFDDAVNKPNGANADGVLGQSNFVSTSPGHSQSRVNDVWSLLLDEDGSLWVGDGGNSRVLRFDNAVSKADGANADAVLGNPNFTSSSFACNASTLQQPGALLYKGGTLYVGSDNRIMIWENAKTIANGSPADRILGQSDFTSCPYAVTQSSFYNASGMAFHGEDLIVSDRWGNRVLVYYHADSKPNGGLADAVLGQPDYVSETAGTAADRISVPMALTVIPYGATHILAMADYGNARILFWHLGPSIPSDEVSVSGGTLRGTDPAGTASLTFAIVSQPAYGTVAITDPSTGAFTYTPTGACMVDKDTLLTFEYSLTNGNMCAKTQVHVIDITDQPCVEICGNGLDDDGDGKVDGADPECMDCDGDGVLNAIDADDDNDGLLDSEETAGDQQIETTIGFGANVVNSDYPLSGTHITYTTTTSAGNLYTYNSVSQGPSIRNQAVGSTYRNLTIDFSVPVTNLTFKLFDMDYDEDVIVTVMDENSHPYDLRREGVLSVGSWITQSPSGANFVSGGGTDIDGDDPSNDHLASILFHFPTKVQQVSFDIRGSLGQSSRITQMEFNVIDTDGDGVVDSCDLDSDGDGCSDVTEAGFTDVDENGEVDGIGFNIDGTVTGSDGYTGTDPKVIDPNLVALSCDTDDDGINPWTDLDDDNDGLLDTEESVSVAENSQVEWIHFGNSPEATVLFPDLVSVGVDEAYGPGIDENITSTFLECHSVDARNLYEARQFGEYVEYSFTTKAVLSEDYFLRSFSAYNNGEADRYNYQLAIEWSDDAFASSELIVQPTLSPEVPGGVEFLVNNRFLRLRPATTYSFRIYFFNLPTANLGTLLFDDFRIKTAEAEIDSDSDGVDNHLDLDSDNDGIYDVIEAGGVDADFDGVIGTGAITDTDGDGWSNITDSDNGGTALSDTNSDADSTVNRLDLDSDGDGCSDVIEAGFPDADGDGQLGGLAPPTVDSQGKVTSGGL